ncbi:MAG: outer membrane beta-barrel protein [Muribaculaceae bacterium]|nr:outer membrane beta-barrel protein [Muribaculaceae bacterium]MBR5118821.1 outer membrane beta-barrel protein [Muribaculaceae bacterium]
MKKLFTLAMIALMAALPMMAQRHNYTSSTSNRYDYERGHSRWIRNYYGKDMYFGLRIGPAFSHVSGDAINYAGSAKTGLHLGGVVGFEITNRAPVFFETGLSYVNKGGKSNNWTTSLSYIEMPLVFKYIYYTDMGLSIHPLFGGYLAVGVDGSIKDYITKTKAGAFAKETKLGVPGFKRFDGGLRIGCGAGFSMFYLDLCYDIGLANISHSDYESSSNGTFYLNFGVNF